MDARQPPAIDELIGFVESRASGLSPSDRLEVAIEVGRELTDTGDALIGHFVTHARDAGMSWTEIGRRFGTPPSPWPGRWTPAARDALDRSGAEARELGHHYVGTEHALLALVSAESGAAAEVLARFGITRERILATSCMDAAHHRPEPGQYMPVMPRYKQALEHARRLADGLGTPIADTEHLLAGILAVTDSMAVAILSRLKARPDAVRAALAERLGVDAGQLGSRRRRRLLTGTR
jgi:Clp amino terminal domain, pathogenicity island component